jgi:hypothetical protein
MTTADTRLIPLIYRGILLYTLFPRIEVCAGMSKPQYTGRVYRELYRQYAAISAKKAIYRYIAV